MGTPELLSICKCGHHQRHRRSYYI